MISMIAACMTDAGRIREENEDCVWSQVFTALNRLPVGLFMVCDGMGGHMGGKFASYWAVETVKLEFGDLFSTKDPRATVVLSETDIEAVRQGTFVSPVPVEPDLESLSQSAIQKANSVVYEYACHKPNQAANAGTTITMLAVHGNQAVISNVGDSRAYLLRDHEVVQITHDHSLVANLVAEGQIMPDEIYSHPQRNMIYRFLGQKGPTQIDIFRETLKSGDFVLLCSDGLWEMVRSKRRMMALIQKATDPQSACQKLVDAANEAGGEDNISVVVVQVL
jgi:serine/threonine protein phosphatase PrpC